MSRRTEYLTRHLGHDRSSENEPIRPSPFSDLHCCTEIKDAFYQTPSPLWQNTRRTKYAEGCRRASKDRQWQAFRTPASRSGLYASYFESAATPPVAPSPRHHTGRAAAGARLRSQPLRHWLLAGRQLGGRACESSSGCEPTHVRKN